MGETEEEKVTKPSEEEEQAKEPSDVGEAVKDFYKKKAEEESSEEEKAAEEKPEETEKEEEEEEVEKKELEPPEIPSELLKLDELLKENPLMIKVDGKDIKVDSAVKLKTYGQFGYKGLDMEGELNKREKEIQKGAEQLQNILNEIDTAKKGRSSRY